MKKEFIEFIDKLMEANPELTKQIMTDDIEAYLNVLKEIKDEKPEVTENGKKILKYLQEHQDTKLWKSKDLAGQMGDISSRCIAGAMRKLTSDGYCEKFGDNPIVYSLTEKGKNYKIIEGEN